MNIEKPCELADQEHDLLVRQRNNSNMQVNAYKLAVFDRMVTALELSYHDLPTGSSKFLCGSLAAIGKRLQRGEI